MLPRPEVQTFTRFLLSAGVFLCVAAVVVPTFVLRETDVLRIERGELARLTPVARVELERRQRVARDLGHAAPFVAGGLLVSGLVLVVVALPGMRRRERTDDEVAVASLEKLLADVQPQSAGDRDQAIAADAIEAQAVERKAAEAPLGERAPHAPVSPPTPPAPAPSAAPRTADVDRVSHARLVEERVLARLAAVTTAAYEYRANVKLLRAESSPLLLDGLLAARDANVQDVIVEIKSTRAPHVTAMRGMSQLVALVERYGMRTGRAACGWLVVVADDETPDRALAVRHPLDPELQSRFELTAIRESQIDELTLPTFPMPT